MVSGHMFKCRLTWFVPDLFQRVLVCVPSSGCVFKQLALLVFLSLNMFLVSPQAVLFETKGLKQTSSNSLSMLPHPTYLFFPSTDSVSVDGCLEWGLMAGLRVFASHGSGILSRGWLATVEAPGYPRHPPST